MRITRNYIQDVGLEDAVDDQLVEATGNTGLFLGYCEFDEDSDQEDPEQALREALAKSNEALAKSNQALAEKNSFVEAATAILEARGSAIDLERSRMQMEDFRAQLIRKSV